METETVLIKTKIYGLKTTRECAVAKIPDLITESDPDLRPELYDYPVWKPIDDENEEELNEFIIEAKTKFNYSEEQALVVLLHQDYDFEKSRVILSIYEPIDPNQWSDEDEKLFVEGFANYGKNFGQIQQYKLPYKTISSIVQHFYESKHKTIFKQQKRVVNHGCV